MTRLEKNVLEWSVFAVSLLLVVATFGYLVRESLTTEDGPPDVAVVLGEPRRGAGGHLVPLTAENRGESTAEDVQITIRLERDGESEDVVLVMPYLPRGARRSGWVSFQDDPAEGTLRVAGVAFQDP